MNSEAERMNFVAMLAQSGMHVPPEQLPSLLEGYQHLLRALPLLGAPSTREAELAVVFTPDQR